MLKSLKIDAFTDVICPWCLIGSARLDRAIAELPGYVDVEVTNHPFYILPDAPPEGVVVAHMLRDRYRQEPSDVCATIEAEAKKTGIDLDLSRQPRMYPTAKPHTLTRLARKLGNQHALANAITKAYFLEYRAVHDDAVLADLAEAHGFERNEALRLVNDPEELAITDRLARDAAAQGIGSVPFFIFGERFAMAGAHSPERFGMALDRALSEL